MTPIHSDIFERSGEFLLSPYRKLQRLQYNSWTVYRILQIIGLGIGTVFAPLGWLLQKISPSYSNSRGIAAQTVPVSELSDNDRLAAWTEQFSKLSENELNHIINKMRSTEDALIQALIKDIDCLNEISLSTEAPIRRSTLSKFSMQTVEDLSLRGKEYKERCKHLNKSMDEFFLYRIFKNKLNRLQCKKAPGNVSYELKRRIKAAPLKDDATRGLHVTYPGLTLGKRNDERFQYARSFFFSESKDNLFKKKTIPELRQASLAAGRLHEEALSILEGTTWLTGANSAVLAMLPHTEMRLVARGKLNVEYGVAPFCGELTGGLWGRGMIMTSINMTHLSGTTLQGLPTAWHYARSYKRNFENTMQEDSIRNQFLPGGDLLLLAHHILQLRQWDEPLFQKLKPTYISPCYDVALQEIDRNLANLNMVIEMLRSPSPVDLSKKYTEEERSVLERQCSTAFDPFDGYYFFLGGSAVGPTQSRSRSAKVEDLLGTLTYLKQFHQEKFCEHRDRGWLPILERYKKQYENCRHVLVNAFNAQQPRAMLTEQDKSFVKESFPIIFASSTLRPAQFVRDEYIVDAKPKLGEDIDMIITDDIHVDACKQFLREHQLEALVEVHSMSRFVDIPVMLTESSDDIIPLQP